VKTTNLQIRKMKKMRKFNVLIAAAVLSSTLVMAQQSDPLATGLGGVATVVGETQTPADSVAEVPPVKIEIPVWKQKLYYGYNFDIYFHHDSRTDKKENGWSIALTPEIGWKLKERVHLGLRIGGSFADTYTTYNYIREDSTKYSEDIRVMHGSWEVTPYGRYRLKTLFNGKVGIWLEAHLYVGMDFPRVKDGVVQGTDYDGLRYSVTYGCQVSPVITYQFNRKSTFQIFFSIMSFGYSGTTRFYQDVETAERHREYSNDIIIFSGKLSNLLANHFTPGLYGLKFGVQKSF